MFASSDWDDLYEGRHGEVAPLANTKVAKPVESKGREVDSYGEYLQGEGEIYVIFEVDGKYYKKFGYQSSYGYDERTWDGAVVEVQKIVKTVEVFE